MTPEGTANEISRTISNPGDHQRKEQQIFADQGDAVQPNCISQRKRDQQQRGRTDAGRRKSFDQRTTRSQNTDRKTDQKNKEYIRRRRSGDLEGSKDPLNRPPLVTE